MVDPASLSAAAVAASSALNGLQTLCTLTSETGGRLHDAFEATTQNLTTVPEIFAKERVVFRKEYSYTAAFYTHIRAYRFKAFLEGNSKEPGHLRKDAEAVSNDAGQNQAAIEASNMIGAQFPYNIEFDVVGIKPLAYKLALLKEIEKLTAEEKVYSGRRAKAQVGVAKLKRERKRLESEIKRAAEEERRAKAQVGVAKLKRGRERLESEIKRSGRSGDKIASLKEDFVQYSNDLKEQESELECAEGLLGATKGSIDGYRKDVDSLGDRTLYFIDGFRMAPASTSNRIEKYVSAGVGLKVKFKAHVQAGDAASSGRIVLGMNWEERALLNYSHTWDGEIKIRLKPNGEPDFSEGTGKFYARFMGTVTKVN
jgi:hypothetical protein